MFRASLKEKYGNFAFITGASSGVGKAFAIECAKQNINCILVSNDEEGLQQTRQTLQQLNPSMDNPYFNIDLSDRNQIEKLLQESILKKVGLVVNCAAFGGMGFALNRSIPFYHKMLDLNSHALMAISLHFADSFVKENRRGAIINVTTANCELYRPIPYCAVYTSTKYFSKFFTESLAYELKDKNVDILNVACGPTDTNFQKVAQTRKLPWCESPQSVAIKALDAIGKKGTIVTHPRSRLLIFLLKYIPLPKFVKMNIVTSFYKEKLAGIKSSS